MFHTSYLDIANVQFIYTIQIIRKGHIIFDHLDFLKLFLLLATNSSRKGLTFCFFLINIIFPSICFSNTPLNQVANIHISFSIIFCKQPSIKSIYLDLEIWLFTGSITYLPKKLAIC